MEVILHQNFKKKFKKLTPKIQDQFFERVGLFLRDEFHSLLNNHSVERAYPHWRSINITGDYRALFEIKEDLVVFMKIGTHSDDNYSVIGGIRMTMTV